MAKLEDISTPSLTYDEGAAPATPASGKVIVYAKADGLLYSKDDAGAETLMSGADTTGLLDEAAHDALDHTGLTGIPSVTGLLDETAHDLLDHTGLTGCGGSGGGGGICFFVGGALEVEVGVLSITAPYAMTITGGKLEVGTAPTGATLICDINKNGTSIYTTQGNRPTIAASGTSAAITAPDLTSIAQGDRITLDIDQIGSTVAGAKLSLTLWGTQT